MEERQSGDGMEERSQGRGRGGLELSRGAYLSQEDLISAAKTQTFCSYKLRLSIEHENTPKDIVCNIWWKHFCLCSCALVTQENRLEVSLSKYFHLFLCFNRFVKNEAFSLQQMSCFCP